MIGFGIFATCETQHPYCPLPVSDLDSGSPTVVRPESLALETAPPLKSKEITPPGSYADPGYFVTTISHAPDRGPVGKYLRQKLGNLKEDVRNSVYGFIYKLSDISSDNPRWGEIYAHADSYRLFQALQRAGIISQSEKILDQLPKASRNLVYGKVYEYSSHRDPANPKWGETHPGFK